MTEDIVPSLLKAIDEAFQSQVEKSKVIQKAVKDLLAQKADYVSVNDLSVEVGNILAKVLQDEVTVDVLPDNKMYYNIANRLLNHTLGNNYQLISDYGEQVQDLLNKQAGIGLKAQVPVINQDRIDGLVEKLVEDEDFDKVKWVLDDPIGLFSQNVVDRMIEANVNFHASVGFKPTITRTLDSSKACKWCKSLAGVWEYGTEPHDIYRKHENCRCQVTYRPDKTRRQDSHTKKWTNLSFHFNEEKQLSFHTEADPIREVLGSMWDSHPTETEAKLKELKSIGVDVVFTDGVSMTYQPIKYGYPGMIRMDKESSYSAFLHEYTHALDDYHNGWTGVMDVWIPDKCWEYEKHAYNEEIAFARLNGIEERYIIRLEQLKEKAKIRIFGG